MSGILSKNAKISYKTNGASTFTVVPDVQSISEIGGDMETVEVTTLADARKRYIKGLPDSGTLEVKALYSKTAFTTLNALTSELDWKVELPETLSITFRGECSVKIDEITVGEAMTMTLSIAISSDLTAA